MDIWTFADKDFIIDDIKYIKHIYFVAETKGTMRSMQLRSIEESKLHCAREHFRAISGRNVVYDVIDNYQSLLDKVMK